MERLDPKSPITLLVPLIGIALILAAVWLTGGTRRARLDRALVLRRLAEDLPGFTPGEMAIDEKGRGAIVAGTPGFAVAFAAGDKVVVRPLAANDVRRVLASGRRLAIDTGDFTHGHFDLTLAEAAEPWAWRLMQHERAP